jgi:ATP-dependent Lon protease
VRNLEREVGSIARGVAVKIAEGSKEKYVVKAEEVPEYLGPQKFMSEVAERTAEPGVATGLAWTPVGGDILFIEATKMPGKGSLVLTGQLGDVMKESAQAALSFVRAKAKWLGIEENFLDKTDIHVHIPAGAIPKDGPSAGVTMFTALASMLTGKPIRNDVAMTGEITLRGNVLPVGGIKEKLLAAHRAGIKRVIIPERNAKDLIELPDEVKQTMEVVLVKKVAETMAAALETEIAVPVLPPAPDAAEPQIHA